MTHEVFIDVRHHPKHAEGAEERERDAAKLSDSNAEGYPEDFAPLIQVAIALRIMANDLDPRYACENCGKLRGEHVREHGLYRCFNRFGPTTQARWWKAPDEVQAHRKSA